MSKIAIFGLGSMGFGMGRSMLNASLDVFGYDLNTEVMTAFHAAGGRDQEPADAIAESNIVMLVVVNAAQVEDLLFGELQVADTLRPDSVVIGCSTVEPQFARELEARLGKRSIHYLDAPISGGSVKAAEGALTVMASGSAAAFAAAGPALDATAEKVFRLGYSAGAGSAMKAVNQLLAGVHIAAAAEAMTFGLSQGVHPAECLEVISQCAGSSWMFENRGPHIVDGDYTPRSAVDIFVKDLGIVNDIARTGRVPTPLAASALQQFVAASALGFGPEDDAAVAKVYARNAGLQLPGETV